MSAWVLILTILPADYHGGAALATAKFADQKSCIEAGNAWIRDFAGKKETGTAFARCYKE